jgi:hypothetical protein
MKWRTREREVLREEESCRRLREAEDQRECIRKTKMKKKAKQERS